jgi:16S rRNA (adenine1518-N6/adenine1519-N6)-dimethyltransferase
LEARGLRPKNSFGQNFLNDENHLVRIADEVHHAAERTSSRRVVELGAGTGVLTAALLDRGLHVTAVERDRDLVPVLRDRFDDDLEAGRFSLVEANAVTVPLEEGLGAGGVLCGNLPYHLTGSLLARPVDEPERIRAAVFLVQLEVGDRIAADPGGKQYGVLSVLCGHRYDIELVHKVPRGAFWPVPDVDGGVLRLLRREAPRGGEVSTATLRTVVKAAFEQRRKTLRNALKKLGDADGLLEATGIDPRARAETLEVERFVALALALEARKDGERA